MQLSTQVKFLNIADFKSWHIYCMFEKDQFWIEDTFTIFLKLWLMGFNDLIFDITVSQYDNTVTKFWITDVDNGYTRAAKFKISSFYSMVLKIFRVVTVIY